MCGIGVSQLFGLYCSTFWENVRSKNWMKGPRQNAQIKVPRPTRPPSAVTSTAALDHLRSAC